MKIALVLSLLLGYAIAFTGSKDGSAVGKYETRWYNQTLDHFHFENTKRWQHRYLFSDEHWGVQAPLDNGCKGPILLYTGNEGPIDDLWSVNGFMIDVLAPNLGALLLFPEERFYGESMPFGKDSLRPENFVYLTTEQILEDYVEVIAHVKKELNAENCPVVAFGGSYGGTLTTFMRLKYPAVVVGGLAASAPIGYYDPDHWEENGVDEYTWADIVATDYDNANPLCTAAIEAAITAIDATAIPDLVKTFHVCNATGLGPDPSRPSLLFSYALEGIPQGDYSYAIGNTPAWPVTAYCNMLVAAHGLSSEALVSRAANITATSLGYNGKDCLPTLEEGPGGVPGDGAGGINSWSWQSCTENLHKFSSRSAIRNFTFSLDENIALCQRLFGITPDPMALTRRYGGYKIPQSGVTNIIWSNGRLDPWHGGGFLTPDPTNKDLHWIMMENGAHHADLRGPHPSDPYDITSARVLEEEIISGWITAASKRVE